MGKLSPNKPPLPQNGSQSYFNNKKRKKIGKKNVKEKPHHRIEQNFILKCSGGMHNKSVSACVCVF